MSVSEFKRDAVIASQGIVELAQLHGKNSQNWVLTLKKGGNIQQVGVY